MFPTSRRGDHDLIDKVIKSMETIQLLESNKTINLGFT